MAEDMEAVVERVARARQYIACDGWADGLGQTYPHAHPDHRKSAFLHDLSALLSERRKMVEALEPFARWAEYGPSRDYINSDAPDDGVCAAVSFRAGDFRKARAALTGSREHG